MNKFFIAQSQNIAGGEGGQVLVETMVALSMTVIGLIGILMVLNASIGLNRVITNQYIASYLASEGVELAGYQLDVNVFSSKPYQTGIPDGSYVITMGSSNDLQLSSVSSSVSVTPAAVLGLQNATVYLTKDTFGNSVYASSASSPLVGASSTPYHRVVFVKYMSGGDEAIVNSVVAWITKGGAVMSVNVEDHFYNWRKP